MNCGPRGCSPATLASTVPPKGTRAWRTRKWPWREQPRQIGLAQAQGEWAQIRSNRASRGRLLLAGQAEQVDEVLVKFKPDGVIGVAVRRGQIAMIAGLKLGKRV